MSFLESIQHGLEKASQEAARITKIQHLHNVVNDLSFKASQQGQTLVEQAMDMYHNGRLGQGELVVICQQIATYQQQINEVNEELQRLQQHENAADSPVPPIAPPPPTGYPAYPQDAPTQAYVVPTALLVQPDNSTYPPSGEPPTSPGTSQNIQENTPVPSEPAPKPHAAKKHTTVHKESSAPSPTEAEAAPAQAPGSYAQGVLPPVYSPFTAQPAPSPAPESAEDEPTKPAQAHHRAKKADEPAETTEAPAQE